MTLELRRSLSPRIPDQAVARREGQSNDGDKEFYIGGIPAGSDHFAAASGLDISRMTGSSVGLLARVGHPLLDGDCGPASIGRYRVVAGAFVRDTLPYSNLDARGVRRPSVELDDYDLLSALVRTTDTLLIAGATLARMRPDLGIIALPVDIISRDRSQYAVVSLTVHTLSPAASEISRVLQRAIKNAHDSSQDESRARSVTMIV